MINFSEINWFGVLFSCVSSLVVGFFWYGPIFGKVWMKAMNFKKADMVKMKISPAKAYTLSIIGAFVLAVILSIIIATLKISTIANSLIIAILLWLGIAATTRFNGVLFEQRPFSLFLIDTGYDLANIAVMSIILIVI